MISLREITKEDIPIINSWRNNKDLVDNLGATFRYVNIETEYAWFESYMNRRSTEIRCAICIEECKEIIGIVGLTSIDIVNQKAEFLIQIGNEDYYGRGIGINASKQMIAHAFDNLNLHKIYLTVLESNKRAESLYKKIGFSLDGILRDEIFKNGQYQNMSIMSLINS